MSDAIQLPNGSELILRMPYSASEVHGITVLVVVSCISLVAVLGLLVTIAISAFNTRTSPNQHLFVRTHVAAYFVSLLLCDLLQAIGSILNANWIRQMGVEVGDICVLQGVFKQTSDVGAAFWTLVIGIHTFCLLFLQWRVRRFVLWATLVAGWSGIASVVIAGPATLDTAKNGPFFSISGYWCWISPHYPTERITLDYMIMFMAAFCSFVIYTLIFLRLRGNIVLNGWHIRFRMLNKETNVNLRGHEVTTSNQAMAIAKQMLLYPVAYCGLILPIAATRFSSWSGRDVPFEVTIFSGTVFLMSGLVNVILFTTTRRILPAKSVSIGKWSISRPRIIQHSSTLESGFGEKLTHEKPLSPVSHDQSYHQSDGSSDLSIPVEYSIPPLQPRPHFQGPARQVPSHISIPRINSAESFYSLYASPPRQVYPGASPPAPLSSHWSSDGLPTAGPHTGRK